MKIGYFLSSEEWGPRDLVALARKAQAAVLRGHVIHRQVEPRWLPNGNSGLRHCTAGSPPSAGRIEFSFLPYWEASYGLVVHLLLLPTPSGDDAVAVGYRFTLNLKRISTSAAKCALRRTVRRLDAAFLAGHA
jgi:hypothetical protein